MDRGLKERLVGAAVLVALAVIFIPMLLDETPSGPGPITESNIPEQPDEPFNSRIVPVKPKPAEVELPPPPAVDSETERSAAEPATPAAETDVAPPTGNGAASEGGSSGTAKSSTDSEPATGETDKKPEVSQAMPKPGDKDAKPSGWVVQLGSFAKEDNARDLNKKLQADGYASFVEPVMSSGERVYRVRVGPQVLRDDAEKVRDRIAGEFDIKGIVISYP